MADLTGFPLNGAMICELLQMHYAPDDQWTLTHLETFTDGKVSPLGPLWQRLGTGPIQISTQELCIALADAVQVVVLWIQLTRDTAIELSIADGRLDYSSLPA